MDSISVVGRFESINAPSLPGRLDFIGLDSYTSRYQLPIQKTRGQGVALDNMRVIRVIALSDSSRANDNSKEDLISEKAVMLVHGRLGQTSFRCDILLSSNRG